MKTDYRERVLIPEKGDLTTEFRCCSGKLLAVGYERVVFGGRGPYIELLPEHVVHEAFAERTGVGHRYYVELRSTHSYVKLYFQLLTVDYADYRPGLFYVSPFDLLVDGKLIVSPGVVG